MFLRIYVFLIKRFYDLFGFIDGSFDEFFGLILDGYFVFLCLQVQLGYVRDFEVIGNNEGSLVGENFITNKPILPNFRDCNVIIHGLSKPTIIGNNKQINQDNIGQAQLINNPRKVHITKHRQYNMNSILIFLFLFPYNCQ